MSLAVGVPVFTRTNALAQFLESIPDYVDTVYIADNGGQGRETVYNRDWPFALDVIGLEFDIGIGPCRAEIVDRVTEDYLFVGDSDMQFSADSDLKTLQSILEANPALGAVSGWLREDDTVRTASRNLHFDAGYAIQALRERPRVEVNPVPFARFDVIPQAGLYRTEIFDVASYDRRLYNSEHIDFFLNHYRAGQWQFASTPSVVVHHHKNIDPVYRRRRGTTQTNDFSILREKYGVKGIVSGQHPEWCSTEQRSPAEVAFDWVRKRTPAKFWAPIKARLG